MNFRALLKHTLIYGSGVWAGKVIGFIMIPVYTRALRPADYGVLELISRTTDVIALVLGMGLASALLRFHAGAKSEKERGRVISTSVFFAGAVGLLAAVGLASAAGPISTVVLGSAQYRPCLVLALIAMGLELCAAVPMVLLRIHERSGLFTAVSLARLVTALSLNIYLVVVLRMGVWGVMVSNLVGISLVMSILVLATRKAWRPALDMRILRAMLAYSLPLVPCSFAMFVLNFGDRYVLRACCGLGVLGVYSLGYKICMVMPALVMEPLGLAWSAVVFTVADCADAGRVYARYFNGFMFCVVFACLWLSALARDIVSVMAAPSYIDAYKIVPVVSLGLAAWAASSVFETGILIEKKTCYRTVGHLTSAVVVTVAYFILIPRYGAMGAAWATVLGFSAMAASTYVFAQRLHPIPYGMRRAALLLGVGGGVYGLTQIVPGQGHALTALARALLVSAYPGLLYVVGYFDGENVAAAKGVAIEALHRSRVRSTSC